MHVIIDNVYFLENNVPGRSDISRRINFANLFNIIRKKLFQLNFAF